MESMHAALTVGGLAMTGLLAAYMTFAQPLWALLECAFSSDRSGNAKLIWLIIMAVLLTVGWTFVVTFWLGGLATIVYAIFATRSRALRLATIIPLVSLVAVGIVAFSAMAALPRGRESLPEPFRSKLMRGEVDAKTLEPITPVSPEELEAAPKAAVPIVRLDPSTPKFDALLMTPQGTVSVAKYSAYGVDEGSAIPTSRHVKQIATDPATKTIYAITTHDLGTIDAETGTFQEMTIDPAAVDLSWPVGIAFDTDARVLIVGSRGPLWRYDVERERWQAIEDHGVDLAAATYAPADRCIYALVDKMSEPYLDQMVRLNAAGAVTAQLNLSHAIPTRKWTDRGVQLAYQSGRLYALVAPSRREGGSGMRVYVIDPRSGEVMKVE